MNPLDRDTAEQLVASIGIPPRPAVVLAVMDEKDRDEPDMAAIAQAIATDVGLSAALLKTVNSPFYGLSRRVGSIPEAMAMLGLKNVSTLVTSLALRTTLATQGIERFWDQSARIALLAAWVAGRLGGDRDVSHLFGLFRDAGMPLLMLKYPDYKETLNLANRDAGNAFTALEDARHGVNHAVVGALLARNWRLPDVVHDAILVHHDPQALEDRTAAPIRTLVALGHLACYLENRAKRDTPDLEWVKFGQAVRTWFDLGEEDVDDLVRESQSLLLNAGY